MSLLFALTSFAIPRFPFPRFSDVPFPHLPSGRPHEPLRRHAQPARGAAVRIRTSNRVGAAKRGAHPCLLLTASAPLSPLSPLAFRRQLLLYLALAPEEKLTFEKAGPTGQATFEAGVAGFETRAYRGCGGGHVGAVRSFGWCASSLPLQRTQIRTSDASSCFLATDDPAFPSLLPFLADSDSVQMLTRATQVGEFYIMGPPAVDPKKVERGMFDVVIYDEEADKHVVITWEDALAATCAIDMDAGDQAKQMPGNDIKFEEWIENAKNISKLNQLQTVGTTYAPGDADATKTTAAAFSKAMRDNECYIVLARPFIEHPMHSAILTVSGRDTGATLFGPAGELTFAFKHVHATPSTCVNVLSFQLFCHLLPSPFLADMQISANTQVKTIEGHYTGHFKAVVTKPQNVFVMRDIACAGYVAGCNTRFFAGSLETGELPVKDKGGNYFFDKAAKTIKQNLMARLSFQDDVHAVYPSLLAFPMGPKQAKTMDTVLSLSPRLLPWEVQGPNSEHTSFPGGEVAYKFYAKEFGLNAIHFGEDMRATENMEFVSQGSTNNSSASSARTASTTRSRNPFMSSRSARATLDRSESPNPLLARACPGDASPWMDARWRRGESVSLKTAREHMLGFDLAAHAAMAYQKTS